MNADFPVVLDTCVLVPASLCDTLLRLAERRLYLPRWSKQTTVELESALIHKIGLAPEKARKRIQAILDHFGDATVIGSEVLIPAILNDEKDRHVVAAAIRAGAEVIVTLNLKDFPSSAMRPHGIEAKHPDRFLIELFDLSPELVIHSLHEQATTIGRELRDLLQTLAKVVPDFANLVTYQLEI